MDKVYKMSTIINAWSAKSDPTILEELGAFIQKTRIEKNKTQQELADAAGINRSTLVQLEKGRGATLLSFIQVLRALEELQILQAFQKPFQISPLALAALAEKERKRAGRKKQAATKLQSDW
jgi:transcriptional regulator with XRE-family HTH domain